MGNHSAEEFADRVAACASRLVEDRLPALAAIFDLTAQRLVRYAAAMTRNQHDAEDAVQTALVRVAGQPELFCHARRPWSYLLRAVRNEALQIVRRKRRQMLVPGWGDLLWRQRADRTELAELQTEVWRALQKLPPEQAEIIVLKIWEEMTFAEIGNILGKSPNTVASRYQYAMRRLGLSLERLRREVLT
jgi:RNA polymerase sigma-70 factor (ECF subfamily)